MASKSVGSLSILEKSICKRIMWKIENLSSFHHYCDSSYFKFMETTFRLRMIPPIPEEDVLSVHLSVYDIGCQLGGTCKISIQKFDRTLFGTKSCNIATLCNQELYITLQGSYFRKQKEEFLPADTLSVICEFSVSKCNPTTYDYIKHCNLTSSRLKALAITEANKGKGDAEVEPYKHTKPADIESLCEDYKKVFLNGQDRDLILNVVGKEFPVHRDILRARSRVFDAMLSHNMKEKNNRMIEVTDCDPKAMEQLLLYIYCGKIEFLDESIMTGLYYAADKYDMTALKEECRDFIKKSLSPTNACEVIQLALNHSDTELAEHTTEYFCNNSHNIFRTLEWQSFMKEKSTIANELVIKSIDALRNAKA